MSSRKSTKHWKCKEARDAVYVIQYYLVNLRIKQVTVTNKTKLDVTYSKGVKTGAISRGPGEYGLFVDFTDKPSQKHSINTITYYKNIKRRLPRLYSPSLPRFTNGWSTPLTFDQALRSFFKSVYLFNNFKSQFSKTSDYMTFDNLAKEIHKICYYKDGEMF